MAAQVLESFGLASDLQLPSDTAPLNLAELTARLFRGLDLVLANESPDWLLVQGDTTTAMVAATCAFYRRIPVAHVEAGLRTGQRSAPFPEEINRVFISRVADLHFAPTPAAADNLLAEGVAPRTVHVTGNTVIDALYWMRERVSVRPPVYPAADLLPQIDRHRLVLVTGHRRESFGDGLRNICEAIRELAQQRDDLLFVYPVHLNPNVYEPVHAALKGQSRVRLIEPVDYAQMVYLMLRSHLILTDSGGMQEEAPALGKPVLVMREVTERPEVVAAGSAKLVGNSREHIVNGVREVLADSELYARMTEVRLLFGDGRAAERIAGLLAQAAA